MSKNRAVSIFLILFLLSATTSVLFTNCAGQGFATYNSLDGDPMIDMAWHLYNTGQAVYAEKAGTAGMDLNLISTWGQGFYGQGLKIMVSDTGIEDTHEDLHDNFLYGSSKDYTLAYPYTSSSSPPHSTQDNHGTSVAGLIAAVGWNGKGSRGVAPKASLVASNLISAALTTQDSAPYLDQLEGDFDISNMSWGADQNYVSAPVPAYESGLYNNVMNGRSGKGKVYVKAAGNDYIVLCYGSSSTYCVGNSNIDSDNVNPYQIVVAALDANGNSAQYSSPGSNIWISSFGGLWGYDSPAMMTTDRMGCSYGEATSSTSTTLGFEQGKLGNTGCNYTVSFNGTSSASPTVAGSVALLLSANSKLTWRDVKYILASTARGGGSTAAISHPYKSRYPMPSGYDWEQGWVTNAAGYKFHNWYGFGPINVDAAVKMAQNYSSPLGTYTETGWNSSSVSSSIPNYSATGTTSTIYVGSAMKVESVRIKVNITHTDISQLALELTSPSGTKSILLNGANSLTNIANFTGNEVFLSNAFFRENSQGTWTLRVVDVVSAGSAGTLNGWSIKVTGGQ